MTAPRNSEKGEGGNIPAEGFPRSGALPSDGGFARFTSAQWSLILLVLAVAVGSVLYRFIVYRRLEQTSALFIGIPAILALTLAMAPAARSVMGRVMRGITLALLLSGPLLGEGFVCILMAAPLFYLVGLLVAAAVSWAREKRAVRLSCVALVLLPLSLEGTRPELSFPRDETAQATTVVNAPASAVEQALGRAPRTDLPLPFYLRLGFPRPTESRGSGLRPGDLRFVHFAGGEGHPGDLELRVAESRPGYARFEAVADHTKIAHWLDWNSAEVEWTAVDAHRTRVVWRLHFFRRLDPAWYFGPWERYAAGLAANYLIEANATPLPGAGRVSR